MGTGYQRRDQEIIDYELWHLPGIGRPLRGPKPSALKPGEYVTCVGAAQTFGCYAPEPFPRLMAGALDRNVLNLGVAGAGPRFFQIHSEFLSRVNGGCAAVVQILSGRSVSNSLFDSGGHEMLIRKSDGVRQGAEPMYRELLDGGDFRLIGKILHETRQQWVEETITLLESIEVPKVLLWFATRAPDYSASITDVPRFFGAFPQLVNREMVDLVRPFCDVYVECVTDKGLPQRLYSRYSGKPVVVEKRPDLGGGTRSMNGYYPSPQMHREAAKQILRQSRLLF